MYQTLTLSDRVYQQLDTTARNSGFASIEEFIQKLMEIWQAEAEEMRHRQEAVRQIDRLREQLLVKYGEMSDSVEMIRADRER